MAKKALITGITGFVGSHLAEYLLKLGDYEVYGTMRPRSNTENINQVKNQLHLFSADILDSHSIYELIEKVEPDYIFHLAAQSFVPASWTSPANTMEINVNGTISLFEAVRKLGHNPIIQIACSSEEYGLVKENEIPINENNPFRPLSPYAVSKIAMDMLGYQYFKSYGMKVVRTRAFNHTGPRRTETFVTSTFAKQIAEIEKGLQPPVVKVGNLDAKRDFTDVRDVVRAYLLAVEKAVPGEDYVIASGKTWRIGDMLNKLIEISGVKVKIEQDPERMRPSDVPVLLGDNTKFKQATGWQPEIPFEQTLKDLLDYWRAKV